MVAFPSPSVPRDDANSAASADAVEPDHNENGVDLSLIRYTLSLTPTQRLKAVENFLNAMASVRSAAPRRPASERAK